MEGRSMQRETAIALLESCQNMYVLMVLSNFEHSDPNVAHLLDKAQAAITAAETELKGDE